MPELHRRRFLQFIGAGAAVSALSSSITRAAAIPAQRGSGSLDDVQHIVVLMQENRSFDHYLGTLKGVRGFGDPRPVMLDSGKPVWHQSGGGTEVLPYHPDAERLGMQFIEGLDHYWNSGHDAWNGGKFDNWIAAKTPRTMAYLTRADIPFHYALADAFTICDSYHCSLIGETDPNRYYLYTGHAGNDGKGGGPVLDNSEAGYDWTTYPERLEKAGISWKIYQDIGSGLNADGNWGWDKTNPYSGNYGDNSLLFFNAYRHAKPGDPLYEKARTGTNVRKLDQNVQPKDGYFDILKADVKAGKLPQISWIAAPEAFCEHPDWPTNYGAWYIAQVLDALTSNPEVWSRTALFITYDENDGYFDHVVPPFPPGTAEQGLSAVDTALDYFNGSQREDLKNRKAGPYGLGPRVPMFVISPWSTGGYACSEVFDHTSVIRFMERRFGVEEPNISPWRRAICGDLTSAFDFSSAAGKVASLPDTKAYQPDRKQKKPDPIKPQPPAGGALPKQEAGSRPTRPLPYEPWVDGKADPATGTLQLTFSGGERAGACFLVTAANRTDGPWTYTAGAGKAISDKWNSSHSKDTHDLTVHGPNGFLRTFKGPGKTASPEVTARHAATTGSVEVTLTNPGSTDCRLTITNSYDKSSQTVTLQKGAGVKHVIDLKDSKRWYDLSITCNTDSSYLRRLAGHVENGSVGVSDPAIVTA